MLACAAVLALSFLPLGNGGGKTVTSEIGD